MYLSDEKLSVLNRHKGENKPAHALVRASVSVILRESEHGNEFLMMQRSSDERDPWSGQMAFPGGKIDPEDDSSKAAAIRETMEAVNIDLHQHQYLGRLNDLYGLRVDNHYSVHIACFVFKLTGPVKPVGNYEVADLVWVPIETLNKKENSHYLLHPHDGKTQVPGIMLNEAKQQILWGLSLRIIMNLYELLGLPIGALSKDDIKFLLEMEQANSRLK